LGDEAVASKLIAKMAFQRYQLSILNSQLTIRLDNSFIGEYLDE